ncbi:LacI family transcriptional regulator [Antarcticibacterium sp. 1MA-6-2]|uniref:LacI family DNA-binding transcriptional regulator n=1 Tax=Antarcticibacterium sp. 1MA-6-2 TaxID=2908210 RepID=UPI001F246A29|nr:LacI family DNA-binding transcriptional regulator [Antarcticibacterium sp. 1MA-6-2]UJH90677.1 LacI family transcriptional regulator [Antarcticibacterium sp. 1MA-6-2]
MKNKRHSIKDIASELKVSITTVSFVLNGKAKEKRISDEVAAKILKYTDEINYKPNQLAQSLRTGKTHILVFMVEDISNYFFSKIARIIEDIAYKKGYKVLFCSNENNDERSRELIQLFYERQVDGFIIIPSPGIKDQIQMLIENKIPVVLFDRFFPDLETNYVILDNQNATYKGTLHLMESNFKKIGFITVDVAQTQMVDRLKGYQKALRENGLEEYVLKIPFNETGSKSGKKLFLEFIKENPDLDAVFFSTNYLTQVGLEVIQEKFPQKVYEFGIITFDDNDLFKIYTPSISAVAQPLEKIGKELMNIMFDLLESGAEKKPLHKVVLEAKLKVRNSSKAGIL